jgi:hypothetical protein
MSTDKLTKVSNQTNDERVSHLIRAVVLKDAVRFEITGTTKKDLRGIEQTFIQVLVVIHCYISGGL